MPSAKTKHSQNDLGGQYKMLHKSLYFVNPSQIPSIVFCASVHGLFLLSYVTWNYCCDLAPLHQGCPWFSSNTQHHVLKLDKDHCKWTCVDRYRFCKIENAVEMLSDGYNRFCSKQVFSKSDISAQLMPQMCGEISRKASHKTWLLSAGRGSYCLWSVVSRWTEGMRPLGTRPLHASIPYGHHSIFVPILVPRARRFLVTWSYGYEILAILVRNRVWLSREQRKCMNVFIVSIQNE